MKEVTIVKIHNPEDYFPFCRAYGILMHSMTETAVINIDSNMGGMTINIKHGDYHVIPSDMWELLDGKVIIPYYGGYIETSLKIWT
jgi:hypothetical protein